MKLLGTIIGVYLFTIPALIFAQIDNANSTPEERAQRLTDWMRTELQLTSEQEIKVHEINLRYAQQTEHVKSNNGSRMEKFKELKSNDSKKDEELKPVLNAEQFATYSDKKRAMQKQALRNSRQTFLK